jgi:uncharacterized membrane protein YdjX (TVP38/TMEM64 family)
MSRFSRLIGVVFFACTLLAVVQVTGLREHFDVAYLHMRFVDHVGIGLAIFVTLFALGNLAQIPGWIFLGAAVLALGAGWGVAVTYLAACISCLLTFFVVRLVGGDALRGLGGKRVAWLFGQLDARPIRSVLLLRMMLQTLPALNYALALSGVRFRDYAVGTLLGLPLPLILYTFFIGGVADVLRIPHY